MSPKVSQEVLADRYGISQRRVSEIIRKNASAMISSSKDYLKINRIKLLLEALEENKSIPFAKTRIEIIESLRKELSDDEKVLVDNRKVFQVFLPHNEPEKIEAINVEAIVEPPTDPATNGLEENTTGKKS